MPYTNLSSRTLDMSNFDERYVNSAILWYVSTSGIAHMGRDLSLKNDSGAFIHLS